MNFLTAIFRKESWELRSGGQASGLDIHLAYLFENKGERMLDKIPKILV
jgi:hypothetical protein